MSLQSQINTILCGAGNGSLGTGLAGCRIDRKRVVALGLLEKGTKFTAEITKASMRALQVAGKLIMLQGVVSFTDNTAEDNIITREGSGIKVVAGKNPYEYAVQFDNGVNFHKALSSLSGYGNYDLVMFDVDGTMFLTVNKTNEPKGYTLGMFENGKYTGSNGTDAASQTIALQLIERSEIDDRMSFVTTDKLDFTPEELTGVNEVVITLQPTAPGTSIAVAVLLQDKHTPVLGLIPANFTVVVNNGTIAVPSAIAYNAVTKIYTLTVAPLVAAAAIDVSLNGIILTTVDVLYKSNVAKGIVTA